VSRRLLPMDHDNQTTPLTAPASPTAAGNGHAPALLAPPPSAAAPSAAAPPSPARHLLTLVVDALNLPEPAATHEDRSAYLALLSCRADLVLQACRHALADPGDGNALYAARDLYGTVSAQPATTYRHARRNPLS
jgi:hypothetical protein